MKHLMLSLLILAGCASEPEKPEVASQSCLQTIGAFFESKTGSLYELGSVYSGYDFLYAWTLDKKNGEYEFISITGGRLSDESRHKLVGKCQNDGRVLKIYMSKEKTTR